MSYLISHTQVYELLSCFSPAEKKRISRFLNSPYHNVREDVQKLFAYLIAVRDVEGPLMERTAVFDHLFPGQPFEDAKLRHSLSYLKKKLERFLTIKTGRMFFIIRQKSCARKF